jgi:hypothetical protein
MIFIVNLAEDGEGPPMEVVLGGAGAGRAKPKLSELNCKKIGEVEDVDLPLLGGTREILKSIIVVWYIRSTYYWSTDNQLCTF